MKDVLSMTNDALSREAALLLCWSLPTLGERASLRLDRLLAGEVDWARFARFAVRHGLAPLVSSHLRRSADPRIPDSVRQALARLEHANALRNLRLSGELLLILRAFAEAGIRAISLKGPVLAMQADGAVGLRIIADLDLLVASRDLPATQRILAARGYAVDREYGFSQSDDVFVRRIDRSVVEVHRRLGEPWWPSPLSVEQALDTPAYALLSGHAVPILHPQDNFLYLCLHAARHGWSRLAWLTAAYGLFDAHRAELDQPAFADRCAQLGLGRVVGTTLALMRLLLDTPSCIPALERLADARVVRRLVSDSVRELFDEQVKLSRLDPVADAVALFDTTTAALAVADGRPKAALNIRIRRPQFVLAGRRCHRLGGSAHRYLLRFLFSATAEDVARLKVRPTHRVFYALARPLLLAERLAKAVRARGI